MQHQKGLLTIGTFPLQFTARFDGPILALDTSKAVRQLESEKIYAIHLRRNFSRQLPPSIPKKFVEYSDGEAGSALVSSLTFDIMSNDRAVIEVIQKFLTQLLLAMIFVSSGGGCGSGAFEPLIEKIRSLRLATRLVFVHAVSEVVNPEKQWHRLRALQSLGTRNELHFLCKNPDTIRTLISSFSVEDFDIAREILVNINAKNLEGAIS